MKEFLDEYITTMSDQRSERVYQLLRAAKIDKSNLSQIMANLDHIVFTSLTPANPEPMGGKIKSSNTYNAYRDSMQKLSQLYKASNLISLILDSSTSILTSEIKAVEDNIDALTKTIDNYAFGIVDNGAYDFGFIETFNDNTMRYDSNGIVFTDRNGINFGADEQAHVNLSAGTLTLSPMVERSYELQGRIINSNCSAYITSDIGLLNALNRMVGNGWRVAISSPRPITSNLGSIVKQGAQFELELTLITPSPCDSLVVTPFADKPFEILSLEIYFSKDNTETSKVTIVDSPTSIDRPTNFGFALKSVSRVKMLINQPVYDRGQLPPRRAEQTYRALSSTINDRLKDAADQTGSVIYRSNKNALKKTLLNILNDRVLNSKIRIFRAELPNINFNPDYGPMSAHNFIRNEGKTFGQDKLWTGISTINSLFKRMMHEKVLSSHSNFLSGHGVSTGNLSFYREGRALNGQVQFTGLEPENTEYGISGHVDGMNLSNASEGPHFLNYDYNLGFRNIQIGRGQRIFRGVFVSRSLPAESDSGEVKIKVDDINYEAINTDRQSKTVTSTEYSITNKSNPKFEADWIPILPTNKGSTIVAERVFIKDNGSTRFRFPASRQNDLRVYRNGYLVNNHLSVSLELVLSVDSQSVIGFRLPLETVGINDIFTVDYEVFGDQSIVNFVESGFGQSAIATAYDNNGAGETFIGTQTNKGITLTNSPYIDSELVASRGSYASIFQIPVPIVLGFLGTYQPIIVTMYDGMVAMNQTNYLGRIQNNLTLFDNTKTAYIHSGRNIVFNRVVEEPFTVYYQYLPSNLKIRTVLRVNDVNYVTPEVNSIQLKSKTRVADARKEL